MATVSASAAGAAMPARVICIIGMHRSGTSCLTGSLQEAGLALGDCHTWNPHNLKGNRENQAFVDLNDDILASNHGAWDAPPARVTWSREHVARAMQLLGEHAAEPVFGFKDPRTLLVLQGWKQVYPGMEFVGIFRNPNAVARSLETRSEMARDQAISLWYRYNSLLYAQFRNKPFPVLCFDDAEQVLQEKIGLVAGQLGLGSAGAVDFYKPGLRSANATTSQTLPWKVKRLYKKLMARCL